MFRPSLLALVSALLVLTGGLVGQDKKDEKKDDPPMKVKGTLPPKWGELKLSDDQKQKIYRIQNKYDAEIDKLEAKIKELKAARTKESVEVLTPDQKKHLEQILLGKDK
jgi:Spy/CpxP family protein refolding chaperone